jgi:hypothetical protein
MNTFFFLKKRHPPPPRCFAWKLEGRLTKLTVRVFRSSILLGEIFVIFWKFQPSSRKSTKFVFEFCGLDPTGRLSSVDTATLSYFNQDFLQFFPHEPLALFLQRCYHKRLFGSLCQIEICSQPLTHLLSRNHHADFFGGNPFVDGILGHSLLLSRAFLVGIPSWMGFEATTCCCL